MNDFNDTSQRERTAPTEGSSHPSNAPSPWSIAFREARVLVLFVVLIATTYMVFAIDAPNLKFERRVKKTDSNGVGTQTGTVIDTPAVALRPDSPLVTTSDTGNSKVDTVPLTPTVNIDSIRAANDKQYRDSVEKANREKRGRDSAARAMNLQAERSRIEKLFTDNAEINTDAARKIMDMKLGAIWLDARPEHEFNEGHIAGAQNFYAEQWRSHIPELLPFMREKIVVYCGGGECDLSHELANGLRSLGFKNVVVYTGGTADWVAKGYKLVK